MLKKLLNKKQNNKGFSLVELIVVVLIIAIIAVALAPQVMKWVGTSKTNVDQNNASTLKSAIHAGVADYMATSGTASLTGTTSAVNINGSAPTDSFGSADTQIREAVNGSWPASQATTSGFNVTITTAGGVTVQYTLDGTNWVNAK